MKDYIENVIKPKIEGDGGEVEFESYVNGELTLAFRGECSKCLILERCVKWIKAEIKRDLGENVIILAIRRKPYFWDK